MNAIYYLLVSLVVTTVKLAAPSSYRTDDIVTVYCQGNGAGRNQAAKYAGPCGLEIKRSATQLERVYIPEAPLLLHNLYTWDELRDIGYGWPTNPFQLASLVKQYLTLWYYNVHGASVPHNHLSELNVAGDQDVTQYVAAVRQCIREHPTKKLVLFGTSRGASVVLIALARLTAEECQHIKLVLVEAPFDTVPSVSQYRFGRLSRLLLALLARFARYRPFQCSPLEAVDSEAFPLTLPLAFITSKVDSIVPPEHTAPLIARLKERNHAALHELVLERSHHSMMSLHNEEDQASYMAFVEALYNKYL